MYQATDYQENRSQLRARLIGVIVPAVALLVLFFAAFILRWHEAVASASLCLMCAVLIFGVSMLIAPVSAYGKHIEHALNGRTRKLQGTFQSMEDKAVGRDGVMFYPFVVNVGNPEEPEDDRLFYMDANLPRPDWKTGEMLEITSYDNRVTAWERV